MQPTEIGRELLRIQHVAEVTDVSVTTVRRWIERGELPVVRAGLVLRIRREDLTTFIEDRCTAERADTEIASH